ncbi:hypothetical protein TNCV_3505441 [Trichonephila clavipes]|uniref:Uncharacterized protein n=1 Tax=Trichonephila clavipes TaxID=2585209 RepID=A0A8X6VCQ6_TRICX|nr:hypothetical protein TNCV_3505441 [Trichonephila clavipes]
MDVCKCIVPSRHGPLNSPGASRPSVRLVEEEEKREVPDHPRVFSLKSGVEPSKIVLSPAWCTKLRLTTGEKTLPLAVRNFVDLDLI